MHPIENLASSLHREFPSSEYHLEVPLNGGNASAWLDFREGAHHVVVEYRRDGKIGVTLLAESSENPAADTFAATGEFLASEEDAQRRVVELLTAAELLAGSAVPLPGAALTR